MELETLAFRQHITRDLALLPGSSQYWLSILCTATRKTGDLFPHAQIARKQREDILQRDVLILLSQAPSDQGSEKCLVSAIEINVYSLVAQGSAIVYISKVDSTGQVLPTTGSATGCLVKSVLTFFLQGGPSSPSSLRVQLFARAQNQYIFPNSSEFHGKRVLTDVQLCRWWKAVLTSSLVRVQDVHKESESHNFYLVPGHNQAEAERICSNDNASPDVTVLWEYGHPYVRDISSRFGVISQASSTRSFVTKLDCFDYIPTFSDDPKARFLVELAATSNISERRGQAPPGSPAKKRMKSESIDSLGGASDEGTVRPQGNIPAVASGGISLDEFWERMGFRQECSSGAVTGFFFVDKHFKSEGAIAVASSANGAGKTCLFPPAMLARITSSLMNMDFSTTQNAREATLLLSESIKGLYEGLKEAPSEATATTEDVSLTQPDESQAYEAHVIVNNPPLERPSSVNAGNSVTSGQPVNVLQVRKKKRPAP